MTCDSVRRVIDRRAPSPRPRRARPPQHNPTPCPTPRLLPRRARPPSTAPLSVCYAPSPSAVREKGAQRRVKGRSGRIPGRRRHDMRDAVPPCKTTGGAGAPGALVEHRQPRRGDDRRGGGARTGPARRPGGPRRPHPGSPSQGRRRGGAHGAPGTTRGGQLSKTVAKAPRAGIGPEKKRGISTIRFRHFDGIRAFATDLDNPRRRGPPGRGRRPSDGDHDEHPDDQAGP